MKDLHSLLVSSGEKNAEGVIDYRRGCQPPEKYPLYNKPWKGDRIYIAIY